MTLRFSPAQPEDLEGLYQLNRDLITEYEDLDSIDFPLVLQWVRRNLEKNLPFFTRVLWNEQIVGYYCLTPSDGKAELDSLFVLPPFQNQGIGTQILRKCQEEVTTPLFLYVFRKNTRAVSLYQKMGFQIVQEVGISRHIMEYQKQGC